MRFGAEVQSIKNRLDADIVKAGFSLCILLNGGEDVIQLVEAGAHGLDAGPVFLRCALRECSAVKAQFHGGDIMIRCAGTKGTEKGDEQDER